MMRSRSLIVWSRWPVRLCGRLLRRECSHLLHHLYLLQSCLNQFIFSVLLELALDS